MTTCVSCGLDIPDGQGEGLRAALHNLLAVIHRDGGHYTSDHGLAKSLEDAMGLSSERVHENERLRAAASGHAGLELEALRRGDRLKAERDEALAAMSADTADVVLAKCVAESRIEAALAVKMPQPTHESDDDRQTYEFGWDDCMASVVKALKGEEVQ